MGVSPSPGTGKTILARRLAGILLSLTVDEALEISTVYSLSKKGFDFRCWQQRPFRALTSSITMIGGSLPLQLGEITLAHYGILFLDELPEFSRSVLESLREPLTLKREQLCISRTSYQNDSFDSFDSFGDGNPSAVGSGSMELIEFSFGGKAAVEGDVFFDFADDGRFSRRREARR